MLAVPRKVLKDRYEEQPEEDELTAAAIGETDEDEDFDGYDTDEFFRESSAFSPSPKLDGIQHDKNLTKDLTQRTTPRPPPQAKSKGIGSGELSISMRVNQAVCYFISVLEFYQIIK